MECVICNVLRSQPFTYAVPTALVKKPRPGRRNQGRVPREGTPEPGSKESMGLKSPAGRVRTAFPKFGFPWWRQPVRHRTTRLPSGSRPGARAPRDVVPGLSWSTKQAPHLLVSTYSLPSAEAARSSQQGISLGGTPRRGGDAKSPPRPAGDKQA